MKTIVFTSDSQSWALRPFEYLYRKYYPSADVVVAGFTPPPFPLAYAFHSIGDHLDYPYAQWSDGIRDYLERIDDELFLFMLEDFWCVRSVDAEAIELIGEFMRANPHVARVDCTTDRLNAKGARDIGAWGRLDMITNEPATDYTCSFQPGVWRRTELLRVLIPHENPHEVELRGTERMLKAGQVVVGTRQNPLRVLIAVQNGVLAVPPARNYQVPMPIVDAADMEAIRPWIP